jgi:hypothetical protein
MVSKKAGISLHSREMWGKPGHRQKMANLAVERWQNESYRNKTLVAMRDPSSRAKISESAKRSWQNINYRQQRAEFNSRIPRTSSIQETLYSTLDDLKIQHFREYKDKPSDPQCVIGPYTFDCVIPRSGRPTLLIECQGEYWHRLENNRERDERKAAYINNNFSGLYEIKYLWEHEFQNVGKITEALKYWLNLHKIELIGFNFSEVSVRKCQAHECDMLLAKYHYLAGPGRYGIMFGAFLKDELIGCCIFSPTLRQNIDTLGFNAEEVRELSRLCIHPRYQKYNFASWLISQSLKQLDKKYKLIIAYSDTTFNHLGSVYKASNFTKDKTIRPDYWYVDANGWVMHKKTLYNSAKKIRMAESEYARLHGYSKVFGKEKFRYVFKRA